MKLGRTAKLLRFGSRKKKSNGNGVCAEFRRLRKKSRQLAKKEILNGN